MEYLIRICVFLTLGGLLLLANLWFVRTTFDAFFRSELVIAPFDIVGKSASDAQGRVLASLVQARLYQLQTELHRAQSRLTSAPPIRQPLDEGDLEQSEGEGKPLPPIPTFWAQPVNLNTALLNTVDLNVSVGGVDVGRVIPWIQRTILKPQMLVFTLSQEAGKTVIAGDIRPLTANHGSLWMETTASTPAAIADLMAHELLLRRMSADPQSRFGALDTEEFQILSRSLIAASNLNDRILRGRPVKQDFAALLPDIRRLVEKVPEWVELLSFAANVADNAEDRENALALYTQLDVVLAKQTKRGSSEQRNSIAARIHELRTVLPEEFLTGLGRRILAVTGIFEIGKDSEQAFLGHVAVVGSDILFGAAGWSFGNGTLPPLLQQFQRNDPDRFAELLGSGLGQIEALFAADRDTLTAFVNTILRNGEIVEPWRSRLDALAREPSFQDVQMRTLEPRFRRSVALAEEWGLRSERGLALCFNIVFWQGGIPRNAAQEIRSEFTNFERQQGRSPQEVERMRIIADILPRRLRVPGAFGERLRTLAHQRYRLFADGQGPTPVGQLDLHARGIGLTDFRTGHLIDG